MSWTCAFCETLNVDTHMACEVCHQPMPTWACSCGNVLMAIHASCNLCGSPRHLPEKEGRPNAPADRLPPMVVEVPPVWKVPGPIKVSGYKTLPVLRDLSALERMYWKNLPFLSNEGRYKDVVWEGGTPVRIRVGEKREFYHEEKNETGHPVPITSLSISDDGEMAFTTDAHQRVCTWNPATGEKLSTRTPKMERNLLVHTCHGVVVGGYETSIRVWHRNGEVQYVLGNPSNSKLHMLRLTPQRNVLVALAANGSLMTWEYVGGETHPFRPLFNSRLPAGKVTSMACGSYPMRVAVGLDNGEMILWAEENLMTPLHRRITTSPITALQFSPFGPQIVMADATGAIFRFRDEMDKRPASFRLKASGGAQVPVGCLTVAENGDRILAADALGNVQVWDGERQDLIKVVKVGIPGLHSMEINRTQNQVLMAGGSGSLVCYQLEDLLS